MPDQRKATSFDLLTAIHTGDWCAVETCLTSGADVDAPFNGEYALLTALATGGSVAPTILQSLLAHNPDLTVRDDDGLTPLLLAVSRGAPVLVDMLLAAGADVQARDDEGNGALFHALKAGAPSVMRRLLEAGAADTPDKDGCTVRDLARRRGATAFVRLLDQAPDLGQTAQNRAAHAAALLRQEALRKGAPKLKLGGR